MGDLEGAPWQELLGQYGGEIPTEDFHGEQGQDCQAQLARTLGREVLLPEGNFQMQLWLFALNIT